MSIVHHHVRPVFEIPVRAAAPRHLTAVPRERVVLASSPRPALRLTRRGRAVLMLAALLVIGALMIAFGSGSAATGQAGTITGTTTITVQPGQTLWSIAGEAHPDGDIRDTMYDIVKLNSLVDGEPLRMGTRLAVPVYAD
ncbi:MAG: LysM domain-containing protein [Aeromicrobium sp.]|uniref:LysM peptidoglycan-binding domain-containing protein n=1 Tax=Aeromicrobium sp. TaxID=1871063 RepID=UPI0039E4DFCE